MLSVILIAAALVALTVLVHATGFGLLLRALMKSQAALPTRAWPVTWLLVRVTWLLILLHLVEITVFPP